MAITPKAGNPQGGESVPHGSPYADYVLGRTYDCVIDFEPESDELRSDVICEFSHGVLVDEKSVPESDRRTLLLKVTVPAHIPTVSRNGSIRITNPGPGGSTAVIKDCFSILAVPPVPAPPAW